MKKTVYLLSAVLLLSVLLFSFTVISPAFISPVLAAEQSAAGTHSADDSDSYSADDSSLYRVDIYDEADLLSDEEENALYHEMEKILPYGNVAFSSVILDKGCDFEKYGEEMYYEYYGNEPGILFQIDMGNRKLTLVASTAMDDLLRSERESIVDNIYTYASGGEYYACASECFEEVLTVLNDGRIAHKMKNINNALLALIISLVLNFLLVFHTTSKKKKLSAALLAGSVISATVTGAAVSKGKVTRSYHPIESSSSGGSSSGGSSGGGGGGGGGFSGGSSSHGF